MTTVKENLKEMAALAAKLAADAEQTGNHEAALRWKKAQREVEQEIMRGEG